MLAEASTVAHPDFLLSPLDNTAFLEDLQSSGLLSSGKAHVISLRPVREALGRRWHERKAVVWNMAENQIRKRIGESGLTARITDDAFLILTPGLDAGMAHVLVVRILRNILTHYLGQLRVSDVIILVVDNFADGSLECRPLPASDISDAIAADAAGKDSAREAVRPEPMDAQALLSDAAGILTTLQGRRLRFSVSVTPIIDLTKWAIAGHRIEPKITFEDTMEPLPPDVRRQLLPRDFQESDFATLSRGLARLNAGESSTERPSLILAVSYQTISNTRARSRLLAHAAQQRQQMVRSVIWEITDLSAGVPAAPLMEGIALLKPFCRSVFASADLPFHRSIQGKRLDLSGLVFDSPSARDSREDQMVWMLQTSQAFRGDMGTFIAANLTTTELLPIASAAGFTHATVRVQGDRNVQAGPPEKRRA